MFPALKRKRKASRGFSLIELMLVVTILGVLGLIVSTQIFPNLFRAQKQVAITNLELLKDAVEHYRMENKLKLPPTLDELLLPNENHLNRPYLDKEDYLYDPWGNPYEYNIMGNDFEIISYGADGLEGGEGENEDLSSKGKKKSGY